MLTAGTEFVAIDTETNSYNVKEDENDVQVNELIEIGAIAFKLDQSEEYIDALSILDVEAKHPIYKGDEAFLARCKPPTQITPESSSVHDIRDEDVQNYPSFEKGIRKFAAWSAGKIWIIHNAWFDYPVIASHAEAAGVQLNPILVIDTLAFDRERFPQRPSHKLQYLKHLYKTPRNKAHSALADSITLAHVFKHIVEGIDTVEEIAGLAERNLNGDGEPMTEMPFGAHKGKPFSDVPTQYLVWWLFKKDPDPNIKRNPRVDLSFAVELAKRMPEDDAVAQRIVQFEKECVINIPWPTSL